MSHPFSFGAPPAPSGTPSSTQSFGQPAAGPSFGTTSKGSILATFGQGGKPEGFPSLLPSKSVFDRELGSGASRALAPPAEATTATGFGSNTGTNPRGGLSTALVPTGFGATTGFGSVAGATAPVGTAPATRFGTTTAFGSTTATAGAPPSAGFGAPAAFGSTAGTTGNQPSSGFGAPAAFGSTAGTTGARPSAGFGAPAAFGSTTATAGAPPSAGFGAPAAFGSTAGTTGARPSSGFGAPAAFGSTTATAGAWPSSGFGAPAAFGSTTATAGAWPSSGFGTPAAFGSTAGTTGNQPSSGFGAPAAFGSTAGTTGARPSSGFGASAAFGSTTATAGAPPSSGVGAPAALGSTAGTTGARPSSGFGASAAFGSTAGTKIADPFAGFGAVPSSGPAAAVTTSTGAKVPVGCGTTGFGSGTPGTTATQASGNSQASGEDASKVSNSETPAAVTSTPKNSAVSSVLVPPSATVPALSDATATPNLTLQTSSTKSHAGIPADGGVRSQSKVRGSCKVCKCVTLLSDPEVAMTSVAEALCPSCKQLTTFDVLTEKQSLFPLSTSETGGAGAAAAGVAAHGSSASSPAAPATWLTKISTTSTHAAEPSAAGDVKQLLPCEPKPAVKPNSESQAPISIQSAVSCDGRRTSPSFTFTAAPGAGQPTSAASSPQPLSHATFASDATTRTPPAPGSWICDSCGKPKQLSGKHLTGMTSVRSDCWPCAKKCTFRLKEGSQSSTAVIPFMPLVNLLKNPFTSPGSKTTPLENGSLVSPDPGLPEPQAKGTHVSVHPFEWTSPVVPQEAEREAASCPNPYVLQDNPTTVETAMLRRISPLFEIEVLLGYRRQLVNGIRLRTVWAGKNTLYVLASHPAPQQLASITNRGTENKFGMVASSSGAAGAAADAGPLVGDALAVAAGRFASLFLILEHEMATMPFRWMRRLFCPTDFSFAAACLYRDMVMRTSKGRADAAEVVSDESASAPGGIAVFGPKVDHTAAVTVFGEVILASARELEQQVVSAEARVSASHSLYERTKWLVPPAMSTAEAIRMELCAESGGSSLAAPRSYEAMGVDVVLITQTMSLTEATRAAALALPVSM